MHVVNLIIILPFADSTYKTEGHLGSTRQSICLSLADHISVLPLSLLLFHLPPPALIKTMVLTGLGKYTCLAQLRSWVQSPGPPKTKITKQFLWASEMAQLVKVLGA